MRDSREAWLTVDAGVLVLAASGDAITEANVTAVRADIVVEGANRPVTRAAQHILAERGIHIVPDIVANCGGAAVTGLVLSASTPVDVDLSGLVAWLFEDITRRVRGNIAATLTRSIDERRMMPEVAYEIAELRSKEYYRATRDIPRRSPNPYSPAPGQSTGDRWR